MDAKTLAAWLEVRLTQELAKTEWRGLLEAGVEACLDTRLRALVPAGPLLDATLAHLSPERIADLVRPQVQVALRHFVEHARADDAALSRFVPAEAEAAIIALITRDGLVKQAWIKHLFSQKAMEELVSDTLYTALRDFSTAVPKLVQALLQSVLPSTLGRLTKLGGGGVSGRVLEELERRLEPEIRRFLASGTRKALEQAASFSAAHIDDPVSKDARVSFVRFALAQTGQFHTGALSDEVLAEIGVIAERVAAHVATMDETAEIARAVIEKLEAEVGELTLRGYLESVGVTASPPYDEWAELTWPLVEAVFTAPAVRAWLEGLSAEILAYVETPPIA